MAGVEGHEVLAVVGPLGEHHCAVADTRHPQQRVLDLADLYPEATDLDLGIPAAEKLQLALGQPAAIVAAPVQPLALAVRIGHERSPRALRVVDVPAADTYPGEDQLTWCAEPQRRQALVHDVDVHLVACRTKRNPFSVSHPVHKLVAPI